MSLSVQAAGVRIASELAFAERRTNESLLAKARLMESLMVARLDSDLPQYEGQMAVVRLQEAMKADVESMNNLLKAHKSLRTDYLDITATPDEPGRCPASNPMTTAEANVAA